MVSSRSKQLRFYTEITEKAKQLTCDSVIITRLTYIDVREVHEGNKGGINVLKEQLLRHIFNMNEMIKITVRGAET